MLKNLIEAPAISATPTAYQIERFNKQNLKLCKICTAPLHEFKKQFKKQTQTPTARKSTKLQRLHKTSPGTITKKVELGQKSWLASPYIHTKYTVQRALQPTNNSAPSRHAVINDNNELSVT